MVTVVPAQGGQFDQWFPNNLASCHHQSPYSGPKASHALTLLPHPTTLPSTSVFTILLFFFFWTPVPPSSYSPMEVFGFLEVNVFLTDFDFFF